MQHLTPSPSTNRTKTNDNLLSKWREIKINMAKDTNKDCNADKYRGY